MKFTTDLTEFNRRMAEALKPTFHAAIKPVQPEDGTLLFRGPVPIADDPNHVGTHVAVSLDKDVLAALEAATPSEREEMTENLISNLGTQVRVQYNSNKIGPYALDVVGTMRIVRG